MESEQLKELFASALEAGKKRNYREAVRLLQEILCKTDRLPEALLYLGRSYHALGDYGAAVAAFRFYLKVRPDSPQGYFFLGRVYLALGLARQAVRHLQRAVELEPAFAPSLSLLGLALLKLGRPKTAIQFFEKALELEPEQPRVFNGYLNALLTQAIRLIHFRRHEEAVQMLQFILKHRPKSLVVHLYLARLYREAGNSGSALLHLEQASLLAPEDPALPLQKAMIHLASGDGQKAYPELQKVMSLAGQESFAPGSPESMLRLMALVLFKNNRYREAVRCGRQVLKASYEDAEMHALLAESFRQLGELGKARNHYQRALERDHRNLALNCGLAAVLWQSEDYSELHKVLDRILALNPQDEFAPYYLALALPHLGEPPEKTIPLLQNQIRRFGPDPRLMSALALEYLRLDLPKLAEGWLLRALKRDEKDRGALHTLIKVYAALGKRRRLRSAYARYLESYPEDREVQKLFIRCLFDQGSHREAAARIIRYLPYEPDNRLLKKMLAVSYRKTRKFSEAVILFKELLAENPASMELLRSLVYCLEETDRRGTAIGLLEKASEAFRDQTSILLPLGVLYYKQKELEKAAQVLRQVITLAPGDWKAYHNLGVVYSRTGSREFAQTFLKRAEELKPGVPS